MTSFSASGENLLVNGSFEANSVTGDNIAFLSADQVPGWRSLNGEKLEIWDSGANKVASSDGSNHLELDKDGTRTIKVGIWPFKKTKTVPSPLDGIYQDVQTEAGRTYLLTFDVRARGHNFNSDDEAVVVEWNGVKTKVDGYRAAAAGEWTTVTVEVEGTGGRDRLLFRESVSPGANDSTGPFLDNIQLHAANRSPNAVNDSASTIAGTPVSVNALGNDIDPDGDALSITSLNGQSIAPGQTVATANGAVTLQANGQLSFSPNVGFTGTETFSYHAEDPAGAEDTATVSVVVNPAPNQAPDAVNDSASTTVGTPVSINALGNDIDPDGDALSITSLNGQSIAPGQTVATANGAVTLQPNGQLIFAPSAGFTGTETFSYHAEDPAGAEDTATVSVVVNPDPNQAPDAVNDSANTTVGTPVTINALGNDVDPDGDPLSITSLNGQPIAPGQTVATANGAVTLQPNGQLSLAPNAGFTGTETFSYHAEDPAGAEDTAVVSVVVNPEPNQAPDAVNDSASTTVGTPVTINALGNDSDPDGDPLSITSLNGQSIAPGQTVATANGSVTLQPNGQLSFVPNDGFVGNEVFSYHANDGRGSEDTAQVQVSVNAPVDPGNSFIGNRVFLDENQNGVLDNGEGGAAGVRVTLTSAGPDGTIGTFDDVTVGSQVTGDGGFYGFNNLASDTYKVTFSDLPADRAFTAANVGGDEARDSDANPVNGMTADINLAPGQFLSSVDAGVVEVNRNQAPDAVNDNASTTVGTPVTINALGNDSDPDGDALSITSLNGQSIAPGQTVATANGSVTLQANGQLSFAPNDGFTGTETFSYHANDGRGGEDTAQVQVSVNAPVDPKTGFIGNRVFFDENQNGVLDNGEGGAAGVRVTLTSAGQDGVLGNFDDVTVGSQVTGNGGYYGFNNLASDTYKVTFSDLPADRAFTAANVGGDEARDSDANPANGMTADINLAPGQFLSSVDAGVVEVNRNQAPDAVNDSANTTVGTPVTINALGNDVDPDGDPLSITSLNGQPIAPGQTVATANGAVTLQPNGQLSFAPNAGFVGNEVFSYHANDGRGGEDTAQVQVSVNAPIDPGTGFIGNRVFFDENQNGVLDNGEGGAAGVRVTLTGAGQDGTIGTGDDVTLGSQVTGNGGFYGFNNLAAGNYKVTFSDLPNGLALTRANVGGNDAIDSDANPANGMTDVISLAPAEFNRNVDAGVIKQAPVDPKTGFIGNRVFFDANANGISDNGEGGFGGVRVTLTGAGQDSVIGSVDDVTIGSQVVGDNGYYGFSNLAAGDYKVTFSDVATGFGLTAANVGGNDALDSDADPVSGMTGVISLAPGGFTSGVDAGIVKLQGGGKNEIFGTEKADWPLTGTSGADSIFGLGGNDKLEGLGGNDHLSGGRGNDHLLGSKGDDALNGTDDIALGQFEVDTLTGGVGRDRFILANQDTSYYFGDEWGGFAIIKDFRIGEDVAVLHGPADQYILEVDQAQGSTNLYCLSDGAGKNRDAIAIFEGNTTLSLAAPSFQFIG